MIHLYTRQLKKGVYSRKLSFLQRNFSAENRNKTSDSGLIEIDSGCIQLTFHHVGGGVCEGAQLSGLQVGLAANIEIEYLNC